MARPLIALSAIYSLILFLVAGSQHFLLGTQVWDIGIFEQFSWLIANGKINEISSLREITPLQDHFSLLLLPIACIYKLLPSTYTLIGLQSISLGTLPALAARITSKNSNNNRLTIALIIAIILCPYSFLVNRGDFHPDILTAPLMLIAISEATKKRKIAYYISLLITLSAKNAQALFGAGLSLYALAKGKKKRALVTLLTSIAWWFIATKLSSAGGDHVNIRLGYLGENNLEIITTLITRPWHVFNEVSPESIALYTLGLSLPFLALLNKNALPALLGALPIYMTNIISASGIQRELNHHYSIGILVFLIAACLDSSEKWNELPEIKIKTIYYSTIILALAAFLGYARVGYFNSRYFPRIHESFAFQQAKANIPSKSSILTTKNYAAHLANRQSVVNIETNSYVPLDQYDYIILPSRNNLEDVSGKLKLVKDTKSDDKMNAIIEEASSLGMQCISANKYIRLCSKESN